MNGKSSTCRVVASLAASVVLLAVAALPAQAAPAPKPLKTFGTGVVTATADSATIVNDVGEYGGVYLQSKSKSSKLLGQVDFEFRSTGDVGGGAPRFSLPIDVDANGTTDGYAFMDAANCGGVSGGTTLVSPQAGICPVFYGADTYANWDAFAAANPTYRIAPGSIPFIIADVTGSFAIDHIVLR
jgi:hypothetical protein